MAKSVKLSTLVEPEIEEIFRSLASKHDITVSKYLRGMILDELRLQGLLPLDSAFTIMKGLNTSE